MPSETTTACVSLLVFFRIRRGTFPYSVEDDARTISQTPVTHYTNTCVKLTIVTHLSFSERIAIANLSYLYILFFPNTRADLAFFASGQSIGLTDRVLKHMLLLVLSKTVYTNLKVCRVFFFLGNLIAGLLSENVFRPELAAIGPCQAQVTSLIITAVPRHRMN